MDVPQHSQALIITDAAVNIAPTLEDKIGIVQKRYRPRALLRNRGCASRHTFGYGNSETKSAFHN
jgi:hypothetical protein